MRGFLLIVTSLLLVACQRHDITAEDLELSDLSVAMMDVIVSDLTKEEIEFCAPALLNTMFPGKNLKAYSEISGEAKIRLDSWFPAYNKVTGRSNALSEVLLEADSEVIRYFANNKRPISTEKLSTILKCFSVGGEIKAKQVREMVELSK